MGTRRKRQLGTIGASPRSIHITQDCVFEHERGAVAFPRFPIQSSAGSPLDRRGLTLSLQDNLHLCFSRFPSLIECHIPLLPSPVPRPLSVRPSINPRPMDSGVRGSLRSAPLDGRTDGRRSLSTSTTRRSDLPTSRERERERGRRTEPAIFPHQTQNAADFLEGY